MAKKWQDLTDKEKSKFKKIYVVLGILLFLVGFTIVATSGGDKSEQPQASEQASAQEESLDAGATLACQHFGNIVGDVRDGLLTEAELRAKLQEVYDDAKVSEDAQVRNSAKSLLAAVTSGTADEVGTATNSLAEACTQYNQ